MSVIIAIFLALSSTLALGQDLTPIAEVSGEEGTVMATPVLDPCFVADLGDLTNLPEVLVKVLPFFIGLLILLRGISSGLLMISARTVNKTDDKIAQVISTAASFMARALSLVASISMPKALLMDKAEKIALKEESKDVGTGNSQGSNLG